MINDQQEFRLSEVHIDGDPNRTFVVPPTPSPAPDLDGLTLSTNDMGDDDLIVSKENGGSAWVKKTAVKLWNYIKTKLGISAQGSTGKYLDEQGNFTTPPDNNNAVTQTISSSDNANYRVLLSGTADDTTRTEGARKDADLYYNPSTDMLYVGKIANTGVVNFTSGDSTDANATSWTSVTKVDDNTALGTLLGRITTMMKNVRYLYKVVNPIGTIVNGERLTGFSIGGSGSTGNVAKITLTKGVWVVSVSTWPPVTGSGAFGMNAQALAWSISNNMHTGGCGIINCTSNSETFYLKFTNWSGSTATSITMDYFRAVRIK